MLDWLKVFVARMHGLFARRGLDRDFQQELDAHLEMLTEENIRRERIFRSSSSRASPRSFSQVRKSQRAEAAAGVG
jgi:hypothetical protein